MSRIYLPQFLTKRKKEKGGASVFLFKGQVTFTEHYIVPSCQAPAFSASNSFKQWKPAYCSLPRVTCYHLPSILPRLLIRTLLPTVGSRRSPLHSIWVRECCPCPSCPLVGHWPRPYPSHPLEEPTKCQTGETRTWGIPDDTIGGSGSKCALVSSGDRHQDRHFLFGLS